MNNVAKKNTVHFLQKPQKKYLDERCPMSNDIHSFLPFFINNKMQRNKTQLRNKKKRMKKKKNSSESLKVYSYICELSCAIEMFVKVQCQFNRF